MVLQWFSCDLKYLRAITPKRHLIILTLWNVGSSRYSEHLFHSKFILPIMVFNIYDNNLYFQLLYCFQLWHPFKWIISNTIYYLSAFQKEFSVLYTEISQKFIEKFPSYSMLKYTNTNNKVSTQLKHVIIQGIDLHFNGLKHK